MRPFSFPMAWLCYRRCTLYFARLEQKTDSLKIYVLFGWAEKKMNQNYRFILDVLYRLCGFSLAGVWVLFNMTAVKETTWLKRMACADQRDLTVWQATRHGVSPTFNHSTKPSLCCLSPSQSPAKALLSGWTVWRFEDCLNQTVGLLLTVTTKQVRQEKLRPDFKKTL